MNKSKSVREMLQKYQQKIREYKENFRKKFEAAPKCVQDEYIRCEARINNYLDTRPPKKLFQNFTKVLYAPQSDDLTEDQILQLQELLRFQGWDVVLTAARKWRGKSRRPIGLQFRYHGHE